MKCVSESAQLQRSRRRQSFPGPSKAKDGLSGSAHGCACSDPGKLCRRLRSLKPKEKTYNFGIRNRLIIKEPDTAYNNTSGCSV